MKVRPAVKPTLLSLLALAVFTASCGAPPDKPAQEVPPLPVTIATAEHVSLPSSFEAGGIVGARSTATIASRMLAPVLDVHVRAGDRVRRGATLVTLDGREVAAYRSQAAATVASATDAVRAADADARSAQASVVLARATYERIRGLHAKRSATAQELDQAQSALDVAEAHLAAARARQASAASAREAADSASTAAAVTMTYARLTAPFDGLVTSRSVDPGSLATPGQPLLTLEDSAGFRLEVVVDEARAAQVAAGQSVDVRIGSSEAGQPTTCSATVSEVARVDPVSHSFLIKIDLPPKALMRSGLFGRARFAGPSRQTLTVPASAAVRRGQLTFVYRVDADNRARLQPVSPGATSADRLEILAGLREGDRVILNPPVALGDGARVTGDRP